jgi:hypothetical protein
MGKVASSFVNKFLRINMKKFLELITAKMSLMFMGVKQDIISIKMMGQDLRSFLKDYLLIV